MKTGTKQNRRTGISPAAPESDEGWPVSIWTVADLSRKIQAHRILERVSLPPSDFQPLPSALPSTAERLRKLAGDNVPGKAKNRHRRGATADKPANSFAIIQTTEAL